MKRVCVGLTGHESGHDADADDDDGLYSTRSPRASILSFASFSAQV